MSAAVQVLDGPTLRELADTVNREHRLVEESVAAVVEHAIKAGEALLAARDRMPLGEWGSWLYDNFTESVGYLYTYMRIAAHADLVRQSEVKSVNAALKLLKGNGVGDIRVHLLRERRNEAQEMYATGCYSTRQLAELFGVSKSTALTWVSPEQSRKHRNRAKANSARRRAEKRALQQRERAAVLRNAVKKAGVAHQEAYSLAERMQDVLAQAQRESMDTEAKQALSLAWGHWMKMRDEIVRALGVS